MANNYYDMTGVLVLKSITPVIKALFGPFKLDGTLPSNGEAYIADLAESTDHSWDAVLNNLRELVAGLGLALPDDAEDSVDEHLYVLASHFGADQNDELGNLIEHNNFNGDADLEALFTIARAFDDGHGLTAYKTESCWRSDKPRLFEFGGAGDFSGVHVAVSIASHQATQLGAALEGALSMDDTDKAATILRDKVGSMLAGIHSDHAREAIRTKLCLLLSAPQAIPQVVSGPAQRQ